MARPKGLRLSRPALEDALRWNRISMTEAASRSGLALTTVSGLAHSKHRASMKTIRQLADGLAVSEATLFPELLFTDLRESDDEAAA